MAPFFMLARRRMEALFFCAFHYNSFMACVVRLNHSSPVAVAHRPVMLNARGLRRSPDILVLRHSPRPAGLRRSPERHRLAGLRRSPLRVAVPPR